MLYYILYMLLYNNNNKYNYIIALYLPKYTNTLL